MLEETLIHHAAKRTSHLRHPSSEPTPPPRSVTPTPSEPPKRSCPHLRRRQPFDKGALGNGGFHPAATATTSPAYFLFVSSLSQGVSLFLEVGASFLPAPRPKVVSSITNHRVVLDSKHVSSGLQRRLSLQPPRPPISSHRRRRLAETAALRLAKIVGSAPGFPHGIIDPIEELGHLESSFGICLHVDLCLGGFVLPFARELGYPIPPFDFSVKGVSSISVDVHKYDLAPKGTSVVLYRNHEIRKCVNIRKET